MRSKVHDRFELFTVMKLDPKNPITLSFPDNWESPGDELYQTMIADVGESALKLHLDTFHMNIEEKDSAAAIRSAGSNLGHFHACGSDRGTPGRDEIDWAGIARALSAIEYGGDVVIESFTSEVKAIARAASIWRQIEPTNDEIAWKGVRFLKQTLQPAKSCSCLGTRSLTLAGIRPFLESWKGM